MKRKPISDYVNSLLLKEVSNICPLCGRFERTNEEFTNHHINHDSSISEYWNLIRICRECHDDLTEFKTDGIREKRVKLVKLRLFRDYFGAEAYKTLKIAVRDDRVTATPINAWELEWCGYLKIERENILTIGPATNISTFNTYKITPLGHELVQKLGI